MPSNDAMEYQWAFQVHYRSNLIQFLQLNVDSECEYIDCHFTPPRISNDYTYDNCGNDFLIVVSLSFSFFAYWLNIIFRGKQIKNIKKLK